MVYITVAARVSDLQFRTPFKVEVHFKIGKEGNTQNEPYPQTEPHQAETCLYILVTGIH